MRKLAVALLLMVGLLSSVIADDIELWKKSTLKAIQDRGELLVGLEPGYMPFEMKDKKGKLIGFDVDMAKEMAKAMGVKVKFIPTAWDGIIAGLIAGKYDIIMSGMTVTQERNLKVNFANPYIVVGQSVLIHPKHKGKIKKARQLNKPEYTIVTKLGVTGEIVTRKAFKKAKIRTFDTESDAASELLSGKADAFVYDQPFNVLYKARQGDKVVHLDKPLSYEPLGWAIRKGDPDFLNWLNHFLSQVQKDNVKNTYKKLYRKWFVNTKWLKRIQ